MSRHVTSCHVMPRHVTSCHVMYLMSRYATPCHVMPYHVMSRHVTSCPVMSRHAMSHHVTSYHFESRGTVTQPTLHCQLTSSTCNQFKLSMTVFVGCPEGCRYHTASAVYDLVVVVVALLIRFVPRAGEWTSMRGKNQRGGLGVRPSWSSGRPLREKCQNGAGGVGF